MALALLRDRPPQVRVVHDVGGLEFVKLSFGKKATQL